MSHFRKRKKKKKNCILVGGGEGGRFALKRDKSVCYIYDISIFPLDFFCLISRFQSHNDCKKLKCDTV